MATKRFPRIKQLKAYTVRSSADHEANSHDNNEEHWIYGCGTPLASPMSGYPQYKDTWRSWGANALGTMVVELETDDGTQGVGVTPAGEPGCYIAEYHLSRFVEGQDPRNIELIWDQMYRSTLAYGRKGLALQVISAVDLALWDLLGKLRNEPVYALLGGKTKERLPVYCTTARPDIAKNHGFGSAKISCPYGPADGDEGFKKNIKIFKEWRDKVGADYPLMLDCYMALNVPYAIKLAKALEPFGLKWMEDYLLPDAYVGYESVRQALKDCTVMLTAGEHEYTRYGFKHLLQNQCVDILQPDIMWSGGITEARRVVAMASAHDIMVIPHTSSVYSYHLQYAFPNCPMAEYLNVSPKADKIVPYFGDLFTDEPLPSDGFIDLPDRPGFGVTLNKEILNRPYPRESNKINIIEIMGVQSKMPF